MTERDYWLQVRAALLSQAEALKQQRAAVLQQVAVIERMYDIVKKVQPIQLSPDDSIAGIMVVNEGSNV